MRYEDQHGYVPVITRMMKKFRKGKPKTSNESITRESQVPNKFGGDWILWAAPIMSMPDSDPRSENL